MARIFISYRRSDSAIWAGRIRDHLVEHFGRNSIFLDVEDIPGGKRFTDAIAQTIATAQAVIVVIGPNWLSNRLTQKDDPVANEIEKAFQSKVRVVPVLIDNAVMPSSASLPPDIAKLAEINAIEIRANHFTRDIEQLVQVLPKSKKRPAAYLALFLILLSIFSYFIIIGFPWKSTIEQRQEIPRQNTSEIAKVTMPKLLGMNPESAVLEAEAANINISFKKRKVGKLKDAGTIVKQYPSAGEQVKQGQKITAFVGTAELEVDFRNRKEGVIKAEEFKEKGITFKIIGNTQSCGGAVLELQYHKLLGNYLAPSSTGEFGLSCAHLQIDISFALPVSEVSILTHAELGVMELWAFDSDGNKIARKLSSEVSGESTKRLSITAPDGKPSIYRAYFYGDKESLIYSLMVKR